MAKTTLDIVKAALSGRMQLREYPFPGVDSASVAIRLLTEDEFDGCRLRAADYVQKRRAAMAIDPEIFDAALRREVVAMCCYEPANLNQPSAFFPGAEDVAKLDPQTVRALFILYDMHREALEPYRSGDKEEVEAVVEALGKSHESGGLLSMFDAPTLRTCVLTMARVLRANSQTSK